MEGGDFMSQTIDDRIVKLEFDNDGFEEGAQQSIKTLDKLKDSLKLDSAANSLSTISDSVKKIDTSGLEKASESLEGFKSKLITIKDIAKGTALGKIIAGVTSDLVIDPIKQSIQGGIARSSKLANAKFQLEGLGLAWEKISEDIEYGVNDTAYGLDAAASAASQLAASGVEVGDSMKAALRSISGVASMSGSTFEDITPIFASAAGKGKVMANEFNRIAARGLNAKATMAQFFNTIQENDQVPEHLKKQILDLTKGLKVTEAEIGEWASKSKINFEMFYQAMDQAYGEHAKDSNKTFQGSLDNMKAALSRVGQMFRDPVMESSVDVFNSLRKMINAIKQMLIDSNIVNIWTTITKVISKFASTGIDKVTDVMKQFTGIKDVGQGILNILYSITSVIKAVKTGFKGAFGKGEKGSLVDGLNEGAEGFRKFTEKLVPTYEGLSKIRIAAKEIGEKIKTFTAPLKELWSKIKPIIGGVSTLVASPIMVAIKGLGLAISGIADAVEKAGSVKEFFKNLKDNIVSMIPGLDSIKARFSGIAPVIEGIWSKIKSFASMAGTALLGGLGVGIATIISLFSKLKSIEFSDISNKVKKMVSQFKSLPGISEALDNIKEGFNNLKDNLSSALDKIVEFFSKFRSESSRTSKSVVSDMTPIQKVVTVIAGVFKTLGTVLGAAGLLAVSAFNKIFSAIKNFSFEKMVAGIKSFIAQVKEVGLLDTLADKFSNMGNIVGDLLLKVIEKVKEFIQEIQDSGGILEWFMDKLSTLGDFLTRIKDSIRSAFFEDSITRGGGGVSKFATAMDFIRDKFTALKDIIGRGLAYIRDNGLLTKTLMIGWIAMIGKSILNFNKNTTAITNAMVKGEGFFAAFKKWGGVMDGIKEVIHRVANPLDSLTNAIQAWGDAQKKSGAENFAIVLKSMAVAVIAVAGSIALLYAIVDDTGKFKEIAIALGIMMGAIMVMAGAVTFFASVKSVSETTFLSFAGNILAMGVCIALMASAMKKLGELDPQAAFQGYMALVGIAAIFLLIQFVLSKISSNGITIAMQLKGILKFTGKIALAVSTLLMVAIGIAAMALAMQKVKDLNLADDGGEIITGLIYIGAVFAAIIFAARFTGAASKAVLQIAGALALLGLAAFEIVIVSKLFAKVDPNGLLYAAGTLFTLAVIFGILAMLLNQGGQVTKGLVAIALSMTLLANVCLKILAVAKIMEFIDPNMVNKAVGMIIILVGSMALLMFAAGTIGNGDAWKPIAAALVGLLLIMGMVMIMSLMVGNPKVFQDLLIAEGMILAIILAMSLMFASIGRIHTGKSWKPIAAMIAALAIIIGGLFALSYVMSDEGALERMVVAAILISGVLAAFIGLTIQFFKFAKESNMGSGKWVTKSLIAFGAMILGFIAVAATLTIASRYVYGDEALALSLAIAASMIAMAYAAKTIIAATKSIKWKELAKAGAVMGVMIVAFIAIALAINLLTGGSQTRALGDSSSIGKIIAVMAVMAELVLLARFMQQIGQISIPELLKASAALLALTVVFVAVGAALAVISAIPMEGSMLGRSQVIMLCLAELVGIAKLLSIVGTDGLKALASVPVLLALSVVFGVLGIVIGIVSMIGADATIMLAKSQVIMLCLAELVAITAILGVMSVMGLKALASLPTLILLTAVFAVLGLVIGVLSLIGEDAKTMLAKSQVVMLVLAELVAITAVLGVMPVLGLLALASLPILVGLVAVFAILAVVVAVISQLNLDGIQEKLDMLTSLLWTFVGIMAVMGLLSALAIGMVVGAASLLIIAVALVEITKALQNLQNVNLDTAAQGLTLIANGLKALTENAVGVIVLGVGLIILAVGIAAVGAACIVASVGVMMLGTTLMTLAAMFQGAIAAAGEAGQGIYDAFTEKFGAIVDFVKDTVDAIKTFMDDPIGALKEAGRKMGEGLVKKFREATGWNSPPKVIVDFFKDAGVAVNDNAEGVTDLFEGTGYTWGTALETALGNKLGDIDLATIGKKLGIDFGSNLFNGGSIGLNQLMSAFGVVNTATAKAKANLINMMRLGQISSAEFDREMQKLTDDEAAAAANALDLSDALDDLTKSTKGTKGATKDLQESLESTLQGQMNIFSKFEEKTAMSKEELLSNMKSQIKGMADWAASMKELATKGLDKGLYQKLAEMGVDGAQYVAAFNSMTAEELGQANELWAESLVLPGSVAKSINADMKNIGENTLVGFQNGLDAQTNNTLTQLGVIANDGVDTFAEGVGTHSPSWKFFDMGVNCLVGLIKGLDSYKYQVYWKMAEIGNMVVEVAERTMSPDKFETIGMNAVQGFIDGMNSKMDDVNAMATELASIAETVMGLLGEQSPSKVFYQIGRYVDEGMANGMHDYSGRVFNEAEDMANSTIESMRFTIANIASMLNDEMQDPVIKPILDLSNVQAGVRTLNGIFGNNQALIANPNANLQNGQYSANGNVVFNQYNTSPKALSRYEIYRDTRNMLNSFRQANA